MTDPYPVRPLRGDDEFLAWARMTSTTYGQDWREGGLRNVRHTLDLDRSAAAFDGDEVVGGGAVYPRELTVPGAVVTVAGVTLVAVASTHRRRGVLTSLMRHQFADMRARGETVAALNASEATIYGRYGYGPATYTATLDGDQRAMRLRPGTDTGEGRMRVLDLAAARPLIEKVYDTARLDAVGWAARTDRFWLARLADPEWRRGGATALRCAVHREPGGELTGYTLYRLGLGTVEVVEVAATTRTAYAAIWGYLTDIDVHPRLTYAAAVDEPLLHLLDDPRAVRATVVDNLWVRLVDVARALAARRYAAPLDVVLDVDDAFCPWNAGRYRLRADGDTATCVPTDDPAGIRVSAAELGAAYLGGTTLAALAAAGRVTELRPGAVTACSAAFRGERAPFHPSTGAFPAF